MNITPVDRAKAPELLFAQRSVHGMAGATVAGYPRALQLLEVVAYSKGRNNPAGFAVPGMDEAIGKAFEATTEEDYLKWAKEANRIATAEVATIPLWYSQAPCGISAKVAGFTKAAQARNEFYNVGVTA
jgi:ABC-type transport system substrate-binding protein